MRARACALFPNLGVEEGVKLHEPSDDGHAAGLLELFEQLGDLLPAGSRAGLGPQRGHLVIMLLVFLLREDHFLEVRGEWSVSKLARPMSHR